MRHAAIGWKLLICAAIVCRPAFSQHVVSQDPGTECYLDDFNGTDCDCTDPTDLEQCESGIPEGGGGDSCSAQQESYFTSYTDETIDSSGNLDAWSISSNLDGNSGEGTLNAWVSAIMPDGTVIPEVLMTSNSSPSVTASIASNGIGPTDTGQGAVYFGANIDWDCGTLSLSTQWVTLGLSHATYSFAGDNRGYCQYNEACPATTSSICGPAGYLVAPPCEPYLNLTFLKVVHSGKQTCLPSGIGARSSIWGTCD
jgi:hypothetical protein